jgi:hypothetical protein
VNFVIFFGIYTQTSIYGNVEYSFTIDDAAFCDKIKLLKTVFAERRIQEAGYKREDAGEDTGERIHEGRRIPEVWIRKEMENRVRRIQVDDTGWRK